jgi:hypothetical protein
VNIFYLAYQQSLCAQQHVDKHVVKMILEYSILINIVFGYYHGDIDAQLLNL